MFPLEQALDAIDCLAAGVASGRVVLTSRPPGKAPTQEAPRAVGGRWHGACEEGCARVPLAGGALVQKPTLGRSRPDRTVSRDSIARRIVIDAGAAATRRHAIPAWFTADVTDVVTRLARDPDLSITTYVVSTVAEVVARHPRLHAIRDVLGNIVTFDTVDVNVVVEVTHDGHSYPLNHVLRAADTRPAVDLHHELHQVKANPASTDTLRLTGLTRWYVTMPAPARRAMMRSLHRLPDLQRHLVGTVGVTSVGMHGRGAGTGFPFLLHTLDVLVGGLEDRATVDHDGRRGIRQHLWVSMVVDHDVVDGVPMTRFVADMRDQLESGAALEPRSPQV
jgi:pyruvate/2-oxoglutarate dehydrogenase complex dihydrolipoamide acyltransferase (E2) component